MGLQIDSIVFEFDGKIIDLISIKGVLSANVVNVPNGYGPDFKTALYFGETKISKKYPKKSN